MLYFIYRRGVAFLCIFLILVITFFFITCTNEHFEYLDSSQVPNQPLLNDLSLKNITRTSITLTRPVFSATPNPSPTVYAYIGLNGKISVSKKRVTNYIQGPADVSSGDYEFTGLSISTLYNIIVIADNELGYSVKSIAGYSGDIVPVMWRSGSDVTNQPGMYGIRGIPSAGNAPGARTDSVSWTGSAGNFWLFGGDGLDSAGAAGYLNDLWKYDGTAWIWISGENTVNKAGIYGTLGVPSSSNKPGARYAAVSWIDPSGNLWLFGGYGYASSGSAGYLNDLWRYDGTNWTWVSGDNVINAFGINGTKGTPSPANKPGGRYGSVSWRDSSGRLWLFGGHGMGQDAAGSFGDFNDLWRYDGTNWTWMSGENKAYGTLDGPDARSHSVSWIDGSDNLWLFGGYGCYTYPCAYNFLLDMNDLWKFNGSGWTLLKGGTGFDFPASYGTKGVAASTNIPGARRNAAAWSDASGNLWLFGGYGSSSPAGIGNLNDLWKFDGTSWAWISGDNTTGREGIYGTQGTVSPGSKPGSRDGSVTWTDAGGNLWLFGGNGRDSGNTAGKLNDLWMYNP